MSVNKAQKEAEKEALQTEEEEIQERGQAFHKEVIEICKKYNMTYVAELQFSKAGVLPVLSIVPVPPQE